MTNLELASSPGRRRQHSAGEGATFVASRRPFAGST
jgi:hypothetical protein